MNIGKITWAIIFFFIRKPLLVFSFWIQGYRTVQRLCCAMWWSGLICIIKGLKTYFLEGKCLGKDETQRVLTKYMYYPNLVLKSPIYHFERIPSHQTRILSEEMKSSSQQRLCRTYYFNLIMRYDYHRSCSKKTFDLW